MIEIYDWNSFKVQNSCQFNLFFSASRFQLKFFYSNFLSSFSAENDKTADCWRNVIPSRIGWRHRETIHHWMWSWGWTGTKVSIIFLLQKWDQHSKQFHYSLLKSHWCKGASTPRKFIPQEIKNYIKLCNINHKFPFSLSPLTLMFQFAIEPHKFFLCFSRDLWIFPVTIVFNVPEAI